MANSTYKKWEERSKWDKFKFRVSWKFRTTIDRIYTFLIDGNKTFNNRPEFQWNYYLWTMKQLYYAILSYAYKNHDEKLKRFIKNVYISYMLEITERHPKTDLKYYNYLATEHMISSANMYRYHCLGPDPELRGQDAHMWLDIMYSYALEISNG